MRLYVYLVALCLITSGCSINRLGDRMSLYEINRLAQKQYSFNFSSTWNTGELIIISQPPTTQIFINNYYFQIGNSRFSVFKNSVTRILLDAGEYKIKGRTKAFRLPASYSFTITPGESVALIFHGPLSMFTKGRFWQVEIIPGQ